MKKINKKDLALNKETVSGIGPKDASNSTFQSDCMCISVNMYCESKGCDPSNTVGPVCCEPGITVDNDNCFPVQPTDPCVPQTRNEDCEIIPMTDENMEMSKCICEAESRQCE